MANLVLVQDRLLSKEFLWEVPDVFATGFEPFASFDVVVPKTVLITGRHAVLKDTRDALDPLGNPLIAPKGELMFEIAGAMVNIRNTMKFGRFANKAELWRAGQIAEHGFRYNVGGMNAGRIFFGIMADAETQRLCPKINGEDVNFLPVYFGEAQFVEDGVTCNRGDQPRNRDGSPYELFVKLPLSFAIARGLVYSSGGILWALSDNVLIEQVALAAALGLRLHWRNYGEPGRVNFLDILLTRKDVLEMMKGFSANCGALSSDEMALLGFIAASAMGCPSGMSPSKYGVIGADGVPDPSQNILLAAHRSPWIDTPAAGINPATDPIRAAHGHAPAFGLGGVGFPTLPNEKRVQYCGLDPRFQGVDKYAHRIKPDEMRLSDSLEIITAVISNLYDRGAKKLLPHAVVDDPAAHPMDVETQPKLIQRFEQAGRLVADYSLLRRFSVQVGWQRGSKDDVEKLFDPTGSSALYDFAPAMRDAKRDALLDQIDRIIEKEIGIVSRRGGLDEKAALGFLGNPYFYFKHRRGMMMWFRFVGADWEMRTGDQAAYNVERVANRCTKPIHGYSATPGKGIPALLMKALLNDVYQAMVAWIINNNRDPKPWDQLAKSPLWFLMTPNARYTIIDLCMGMVNQGPLHDKRSRKVEGMILHPLTPDQKIEKTGPQDRIRSDDYSLVTGGIPAAFVLGHRWDGGAQENGKGGILANAPDTYRKELETIWEVTKDLIWSEKWSLSKVILGQLRHATYGGMWDGLADEFESRVKRLVEEKEVHNA